MRRPGVLLGALAVIVLVGGAGIVAAATITGTTSGTVVWESPSGPTIETTDIDVSDDVPIRSDRIVYGDLVLSGGGEADLNANDISDGEVTLRNINSSKPLFINRSGTQRTGFDGSADALTVRPVDVSTTAAEFETINASGDLTVSGFEPGASLTLYRDGSRDELVSANQSGAVTVAANGTETLSFAAAVDPDLLNPFPAGGDGIGQDPVPLQIDVQWELFGEVEGAEVDLTWYLNGQQVTTSTLTEGGTETVEVTDGDGINRGRNDWRVEAETSAGNTINRSGTFRVPEALEIRDELNPNQLVNDATVTLTFFGEDENVIERTVDDGIVDMTGLPIDQGLAVSADAEGFVGRTTYVPSVLEQQRIYLINSSQTETVETQFGLSDPTGTFTDEGARIEIQKSLRINGTTRFRPVVGDRLGSPAFSTVLEKGERYSIKVYSGDGQERELGPYEATSAQRVELAIDDISLSGTDFSGSDAYSLGAQFLNETVPSVQVELLPQNATIDRFEYRIYQRSNESRELANESIVNLNGEYVERHAVPSAISNPDLKTYVLEFTVVADGTTVEGSQLIGAKQAQLGFDAIPSTILHAVGMGLILLVGGLFSQANVGVGAIATSLVAGGLWFLGALPAEVSGIAIAVALLLGVFTFVRSRGRTPTP